MSLDLPPQLPLPFHAASLYAAQAIAASSGPWPGVVEHRNQCFGSNFWERFDVFTPEEPQGLDVVIFLHGGGWTNGYKEWSGFMAPGITAQSCLLVTPTYRLAPENRYPVFLRDAIIAIREIRARIAEFGGNPDRIFLAGHSAGAHLASQIALRPDLCIENGLPADALSACLPISAILDMRSDAPTPGSLEARVYEMVLEDPSQDWDASPLAWLDNLHMPMSFSWGAADSGRVRASNEAACASLADSGKPARFHIDDTDHFGSHLSLMDCNHRWYRELATLRQEIA